MKKIKNNKLLIIILFIVAFTFLLSYFTMKMVIGSTNHIVVDDINTEVIASDGIILYGKVDQQDFYSSKWAILSHPYGTEHSVMNKLADAYFLKGYNVVSVDARAHGKSEGKYIGMGYLDQYDVEMWINYIVSIDGDSQIVLHGLSMGATTGLLISDKKVSDNLKAIISDSGYSSLQSFLMDKISTKYGINGSLILYITNISFCIFADYSIYDVNAIESVRNSRIPFLFIHGTEDTSVKLYNVYDLFNAALSEKELYIVEGADHCHAIEQDYQEYIEKTFNFLERYIQ